MAALSTRAGAESLKTDIERLKTLDVEALRIEWRSLHGKRAPKSFPKSLLVRALAYQLQASALGDLDPQTLRVLEAYAAKSKGRWKGRVRTDWLSAASATSSGPRIKPGSVLVREWAGDLHRVVVLEVGFGWNGATYRSLSEVARAITGTRWNGPRFFGLERVGGASGGADEAAASRRETRGRTNGPRSEPSQPRSRRLEEDSQAGEMPQ